eukprot:CAMPEP_0198420148 /NCGR_PEP_ID=MMETSP1452-20131203/705_1 /TAXON_ID=1181717 /ORGANISM="Synchroma pusillum, Strain CCMP3072" /LENGTH=233 /DNA_ID=CAMNT_0044140297 /DNA_START=23 /DNA_END=720 /DNA_ORIENTATION=+
MPLVSEERLVELLGRYAAGRTVVLTWLRLPTALGHAVHAVCFLTTLSVLGAVFSQERRLDLFSFHPLCMSLGTLLFVAEGVVSYRNRFLLEALADIMDGQRRSKNRAIHQTLQALGTAFILLGLLLILANKVEVGHTIMPLSIHSMVGTVAVLLCLAQAAVGFQKMAALQAMPERRVHRYHGEAGLLVFDALMLSVFLGMLSFLYFSMLNFLVEMSVIVLWGSVHVLMRSTKP